ncbi:DinB family protein [Aquabacterium humicola]|uniref:DinB family protein n=1 Tax=Aquabacterium humicola TaxID=3237377 RepID=UPI00254309FA|nr:DinB family protein [Rubrivivax pictus]
MSRAGVPQAVHASRLPAPPERVWAHVHDSGFIADYLGAALPRRALEAGAVLTGHDAQGRAITITVLDARPPTSLVLVVDGAGGRRSLHCAVAACDGGSRLTLLHEALDGQDGRLPRDAVADALGAAPRGLLPGARIGDEAALAAARAYLAGSAAAVRRLLDAMPADAGYRKPAPDRFSLVEHLWHLADVEQLGWAQRWPRVLHDIEPELAGVDGDRLAIERRYQQRPWRGAARRFVAQRARSLAALARCDAEVLARPIRFGGPTTAGDLLAAMVAHDQEHRAEMALLWNEGEDR